MVWVIDNIVTFVQQLTSVATSDPISALLVVAGGLVFAFSFAFFGYLAFRGLLDVALPDVSSGGPPDTRH